MMKRKIFKVFASCFGRHGEDARSCFVTAMSEAEAKSQGISKIRDQNPEYKFFHVTRAESV